MLRLGSIQQDVHWPAAEITLTLVPLPEDVDRKFIEDTTTLTYDEQGKLKDIKRDLEKYAESVGLYCIKGWKGVVDGEGDHPAPVECTPDNIKRFMQIGEARNFTLKKVKSLSLHLVEDFTAAKKD